MGDDFQEPEIVQSPERTIVALARDFTMDTRHEIPGLWNEFFSREFNVPSRVPGAMFGVSFAMTAPGAFRYGVGVEADDPKDLPEGACRITLSEGTYAVFHKQGPVTGIPALMDHIYCTWLPDSGFAVREGAWCERYPDDPNATPENMTYEIWAPVSKL